MKTIDELKAMPQKDRNHIHAIAREACDSRLWSKVGVTLKDLPLDPQTIEKGVTLLGVDINSFYEGNPRFQAFDHEKVCQACGLEIDDDVSYAMLWYNAFGEEGLRFICSLPIFIAPEDQGT